MALIGVVPNTSGVRSSAVRLCTTMSAAGSNTGGANVFDCNVDAEACERGRKTHVSVCPDLI